MLSKRKVQPPVPRRIIWHTPPDSSHYSCLRSQSHIKPNPLRPGTNRPSTELWFLVVIPATCAATESEGSPLRPASNHIDRSQARRLAQLAQRQRPTATRTPDVGSKRFSLARSAIW